MDIMIAVQDVCVSSQWFTAIILSLCCFLPSCLPAGQTVDYASIESVVTRQGDTALLRCTSDGISKGAWLNRSSIIFAGNDKWSVDPRVSIVSSGGEYSLQIQKVDVTDDGLYTCSVQSERNPKPKHLHLVVKVPPKIYDISSDITVNEGSNVSLICTASGKPDPTISWRHITPLARKYDSGEYLNITGITRDQAGDYECSAMNDIASPDSKTVKVIVKCKYISVLATIWLPKQILIYINMLWQLEMSLKRKFIMINMLCYGHVLHLHWDGDLNGPEYKVICLRQI
uniref:Neuronal growth regulator 1 n=1 Tax=Hucho hucho TaxID=62062 RepID=A0A4W5KK93_9TELE